MIYNGLDKYMKILKKDREHKTKFKNNISLDWFTSNFDEIFKVKYLNNNSNNNNTNNNNMRWICLLLRWDKYSKNIKGLGGVTTAILLKRYLASINDINDQLWWIYKRE